MGGLKEFIGLYLDIERITLVRSVKESNSKLKIIAHSSVVLPQGVIKRSNIDTKALTEIIKKMCLDCGVKPGKVALSLSFKGIVIKAIDLPIMSDEQTKVALKQEIAKYAMLGEANSLISHCRINKEKAWMVAINKKIGLSVLEAITQAGLDLVKLEIAPFSLARVLKHADEKLFNENNLILISITAERIDAIVVKTGVVVFSHSREEVTGEALANEIKMVSTYWEQEFSDVAISKVIVFTDKDQYRDSFETISQETGLEMIEPQLSFFKDSSGDDIVAQTAALGAGFSLWDKTTLDINLVPLQKLKKDIVKKDSLIAFGIISSFLFLWFMLSSGVSFIEKSYKEKLKLIKKQLTASSEVLAQVEKLNQRYNFLRSDLKQKGEFIRQLDILPWLEIVNDLAKFIPPEVWLQDMVINNKDRLIIKGRSYSESAVYKYVNLLRYSDYFDEPKLIFLESRGVDNQEAVFTIDCPLKKL